jgi:hypothetical protein
VNPLHSVPVLRFSVEGMAAQVNVDLAEYATRMASDVQQAVDECLTVENVSAIIKREAALQLEAAIKGQIESYFKYGAGQKMVKAAVEQKLGGNDGS